MILRIEMTFTDEDFIKLLDYCKDASNFHENAQVCYDNIFNISRSSIHDNSPLIEDMRFWLFNFDNICKNVIITESGRPGRNLPASTDGLHFRIGLKNNILYFIEFKNTPLDGVDYTKKFKKINGSLYKHCAYQQDFCPITLENLNCLHEIYIHFEDERICKLKIKTNESLFFGLPMLYEHYCKNNGLNYKEKLKEFIPWLLNSKKRFILVFANKKNIRSKASQSYFGKKLKDKYNRFERISNISTCIITKSQFESEFINELSKLELPPCILMKYVNWANIYNNSDFKESRDVLSFEEYIKGY